MPGCQLIKDKKEIGNVEINDFSLYKIASESIISEIINKQKTKMNLYRRHKNPGLNKYDNAEDVSKAQATFI